MSELTKQALKVENNMSFPNNNAGLITPSALRTFNEDMIDSTVNQQVYTTDSASFDQRIDNISGGNTGSLLTTASAVSNVLTFTKGDGSTFNVTVGSDVNITSLNAFTASQLTINSGYNTFTGSASSRLTNLEVTTASLQTQINGLSGRTGSYATTGSNTFTGTQTISGLNNNLVLSGPGGTISLTQKPDFVTKFDPSTLSGVEVISGVSRIDSTGLDISGSQFWQTSDGTFTKLGINGSQRDLRIGFGTTYDSANYTHRFTSSSVEFSSSLSVRNALTASGLRYPATDNGAKSFIQTDGAGNLSLQYVQSVYETIRNMSGVPLSKGTPVYISGSTGDNGNAYIADASDVTKMPATYIVGEDLTPGQTGLALVQGKIEGVNTTGYPAGTEIYVAEGGGWSDQRPSGSLSVVQKLGVVTKEGNGGQGIVINQLEAELPNLQTGRTWVGNGTNQPIATTTASLSSYIFTQDNTFTGTQTFNNIVVNGTASIAYIENVTGSAKIIGDAFIILNNDTPTERYAGMIVIDSGSANTTASFQFDGQTNDWFYEYTDDGGVTTDHGVALFGPEYNTKGSPIYPTNNRIQKGDGGHHLLDTNISDDGSNVSINSNTQITGSLLINGQPALTNSDIVALNDFTQSQISVNTNLNAFTSSASGRLNNIELTTQSLQSQINGLSGVTGSYATTGSNTFTGTQIFTQPITSSVINVQQGVFGNGINLYQDGFSQIRFWSGSNQTQIGTWVNMQVNPSNGALAISSFPANNHFVDFDVEQTASIFDAPIKGFANNLRITSNATITGSLTISGSATTDLRVIGNTIMNGILDISGSGGLGLSNTNGTVVQYFGNSFGSNIGMYTISDATEIGFAMDGAEWTTNWGNGPILYVNNTPGDTYEGVFGFQNKTTYTDGRITALKPLDVSGSLSVSGSVNTSVHTLDIVSQTASLDGSKGNMFVLNLVSGSNTRLEVSNLRPGQTINLLVSQSSPAGGTLTTAPNLLEPSGSEYSASQVANAQDILTLATFFNPNIVYVANITNLI